MTKIAKNKNLKDKLKCVKIKISCKVNLRITFTVNHKIMFIANLKATCMHNLKIIWAIVLIWDIVTSNSYKHKIKILARTFKMILIR